MTENELSRPVPRGIVPLAWALIIFAAMFAGYQQLFCTFAQYDDEGYVMISLQSFLDGQPLYNQTFTQYGPAYYFLHGGLHRGLSLPITHHVTRLKTLVLWLGTAAMSALFVFRVTREQLVAMGAFAAVFLHLDKLPLETGHPQEQCAFGIASLLVVATIRIQSMTIQGVVVPLALGALCGLVTMTKINVGVLLSLGTLLGLLISARPTTLRNVLLAGAAAASLLLPLVLFRGHLLEWKSNPLPFVTVLSVAGGLLAVAASLRDARPKVGSQVVMPGSASRRDATTGYFAAALMITMGSFAGATVWNGTPPTSLFHGLVGQHAGFTDDFFHPPSLTPLAVPIALGMALLAIAHQVQTRCLNVCRLAATGLAVYSGIAYLSQSGAPPAHGMQERGGMWVLVSYAPSLMWLLLVPPMKDSATSTFAARIVLAFVAILQALTMFPTPGTQVAVGTFPLMLGCLILGHDCLASWQRCVTRELHTIWSSRIAIALLTLFLVAVVSRDIRFWHYRSTLTPLALPGTGALRLPAETVLQQRRIVAALNGHADTFVFANQGRNSVYFWTEIQPPTSLNVTFWRFLLRPDQQKAIVEALERYPNACVIHEDTQIKLPVGPLVEYILDEFEPARTFESWQLWIRKGRQLPRVNPTRPSTDPDVATFDR